MKYLVLICRIIMDNGCGKRTEPFAAVKNYEIYQEQFEPKGISLEDYWVQTGKSLEFVKRDGDKIGSIKYWIPPRTETMADTNWLDIKGYANKWGFKTENSEGVLKRVIDSLSEKDDYIIDCFLGSGTTAAVGSQITEKVYWNRYGRSYLKDCIS